MNIIIAMIGLNILQEIASTAKTLLIVRGKNFKALLAKLFGILVSTLTTVMVVGGEINMEAFTKIGYVILGTIVGSGIINFIDRKNRKPAVLKYTIKFDTKENKEIGIVELQKSDIDHIAIGSKSIIAYSNSKNESAIIKKLQHKIQTECITIRSYNIE